MVGSLGFLNVKPSRSFATPLGCYASQLQVEKKIKCLCVSTAVLMEDTRYMRTNIANRIETYQGSQLVGCRPVGYLRIKAKELNSGLLSPDPAR